MDPWTFDHVATLVAGVLIALGRIVPTIAELARRRAKRLPTTTKGAELPSLRPARGLTNKNRTGNARRVRSRVCVVTTVDSRGIEHQVEVMAESLFEAGILAIAALRTAGWIDAPLGIATRLEIEVREPALKHVVTVGQLERWVAGTPKNRGEKIRRARMRELLDRTPRPLTCQRGDGRR